MDYLEYKGYKGSVEFSKEDDCLVGKVQGLGGKALILYEGHTLEELKADFIAAVDSYLEGCADEGIEPAKPYSGKLNLRMPSELHARVANIAASIGTTINDFINKAIINELDYEEKTCMGYLRDSGAKNKYKKAKPKS
ncbi:MAG: type II toxin-antitoxin system HicB family antitoxin [Bacteroidales bacterium]|nr:type II toxin-antitoxin system HicB family antitoxin [Bacteroidales bacterium]